ncbi:heptahelical transmembrane protein 4-like [Elaeis guineensis]|uniref:Heptahelical transmembrane protein 4-like n=1 Tax=Elaeis guineensis var. tenera TaxID=51953 RepID=A0A6J0PRS6_ELAGV|nr:heptahelical transmembrane protein 4-like [Elaeis guineensis]
MSFEDSMVVSAVAFEKTCSLEGSGESNGMELKEGRIKKRVTKEVKCELVNFDSLPDYFKDNEFILGYYRCEWPLRETILSIFSIHNETLNVWTHLIGFLIFLSLTIFTATMIPREMNVPSMQQSSSQVTEASLPMKQSGVIACLPSPLPVDELETSTPASSIWHLPELLVNCLPKRFSHARNITNPCILISVTDHMANIISQLLMKEVTRWPFFAFLCGAMFCLLTSSICHLIFCHSKRTAYIMLRLDYTGITALIVTSFYPLVYYSFLCEPFYCHLYMSFITAFGLATILVSLVPVFQTAEFRSVRAGLFFCMGVSGLVPIMHKLIAFHHRPEAILSTGYELLMGTFYGLGVVVYATRIPERCMPGKFDIVGHSHQLFHVLVIAGAYAHYLAGLVYLKWRDTEGC